MILFFSAACSLASRSVSCWLRRPLAASRLSALVLQLVASAWSSSYFRSRLSMYSFFFRRLSWAEICNRGNNRFSVYVLTCLTMCAVLCSGFLRLCRVKVPYSLFTKQYEVFRFLSEHTTCYVKVSYSAFL